jgi:hypothetical protein
MVESFQRRQAPRRKLAAGSLHESKVVLRVRVMRAGLAVVPSRDYSSPAGLAVTALSLVQVFFVPAVPVPPVRQNDQYPEVCNGSISQQRPNH